MVIFYLIGSASDQLQVYGTPSVGCVKRNQSKLTIFMTGQPTPPNVPYPPQGIAGLGVGTKESLRMGTFRSMERSPVERNPASIQTGETCWKSLPASAVMQQQQWERLVTTSSYQHLFVH